MQGWKIEPALDLTPYLDIVLPVNEELYGFIEFSNLKLVFSFKCIIKIKSSYNLLSRTRVRRGFDHLTYLHGEIFDKLLSQIPTQCPKGDIKDNN